MTDFLQIRILTMFCAKWDVSAKLIPFCIKENLMSYPELRPLEHFSLFMSTIVATKNIGSCIFHMHENKINNFYNTIIF